MMFFFSWLFLYIFILIEAAVLGNTRVNENQQTSAWKQSAYVCGVVIIYALFIIISFLTRHVTGDLIVLMIVFVFIFSFGACITIMFFKQIMGPFRKLVRKQIVANDAVPHDELPSAGKDNTSYVSEKL